MIVGTSKYAALRGITDGYVRKCIIENKPLPGVIAHQKIGKTHLLTIDIPSFAKYLGFTEKNLKKYLET